MVFKQDIETIDVDQERRLLKQDIESYVPERTTFDFSPVSSDEIFETATANVIRNIPEITAVATGASIAVGITAGAMTKGLGYAPSTAAAMFIASKVLPGIMIGSEYISALWKSKTEPAWRANLSQMTTEEVLSEDGMSEFSKGMVESMTLGMAIPKGEETFKRGMGNLSGGIVRDYLVIAGLPIPAKGMMMKRFGQTAVNDTLLAISMTVNNGVEEYNKSINTGNSQDVAYKMGQAAMIGNGVGSIFGFGIAPRLQNKLFKNAFGGKTVFGKLTGGVNLAVYDTAMKVSGGMVIDGMEAAEGKEITNKYDMTGADALGIFGVGLAFQALPWGAGKILKGMSRVGSYGADKVTAPIKRKLDAKKQSKAMADSIQADYKASTLNGENQDILEKDLTKDMIDGIIDDVVRGIDAGYDKNRVIKEIFKEYPAEYANEKNIRSVEEIFKNVI